MSNGVQFDIDSEPRAVVQDKTPAMVKLVIKLSGGLIKEEAQANYVLIGFAGLAIIGSLFLFFLGENIQSKSQKLSDEMLIQMTQIHVNQ